MTEHQSQSESNEMDKQEGRRNILKKGSMLAGLGAVASFLNLVPTSGVFAATHSSKSPLSITPLSGEEAMRYVQATLSSSQYQQFQTELSQKFSGTFSTLETHPIVCRIIQNNEEIVLARIPVSGGAGFSHFVAVFAPSSPFTITFTQGGLFSHGPNNHIHAWVVQRDTRGQVTKQLDVLFASDGQHISGNSHTNGIVTSLDQSVVLPASSDCGWGCWWDCIIGDTSAPAFVLGIIVTLCGDPCSKWLPISESVCAGCITVGLVALIGAVAYDIFYCIGYCIC